MIYMCFILNGTKLRSFGDFQILTEIVYKHIIKNFENRLIFKFVSFTVKLQKSMKMIKFDCKYVLHLSS